MNVSRSFLRWLWLPVVSLAVAAAGQICIYDTFDVPPEKATPGDDAEDPADGKWIGINKTRVAPQNRKPIPLVLPLEHAGLVRGRVGAILDRL
jgi:hypothetical protein